MAPPTVEENHRILTRIEVKLDTMGETIHGAGESPGIKGRLDRLEQREKTRTFWGRTIGTTALGALMTSLWAVFSRGGH